MLLQALIKAAPWAVPAGLALACWLRGLWEPRHPEETRPELGSGARSLRILLLSDLHAGLNRVSADSLCAAIDRLRPDVVVHAGDACSGDRDADRARTLLQHLGRTAVERNIPFYSVYGNHDTMLTRADFETAGITLLENECAELRGPDDTPWLLCGLEDRKKGTQRFPDAETLPADIPADRVITLAHNPDTVLDLSSDKTRFLLCGHFHGGQIWAPFNLEFAVLRHEKMASMGHRRGAFEYGGVLGYISRGVGNVVFPLRFRSRPEIPLITLRAPEAEDRSKETPNG